MKLKKPQVDTPQPTTPPPTSHEVARFIAEGDKRPSKGSRAISRTYRLNQAFIDIMEAEAMRTGRGNTDILKAALAAYSNMNDNDKNYWLLESSKL
ncbi:stability/ partitioning determinant [Salmonella enterica]